MRHSVILLVEGDPKNEALTIRALKKSNLVNDVVVARDGADALDYLFGTGAYEGRDVTSVPQLILMDLKLPKVDGLQVLGAIRKTERLKRLPVVIFTSSGDDGDMSRSYDLGGNSFIKKPVDFGQFADAMQQLVNYWLRLNSTAPTKGY